MSLTDMVIMPGADYQAACDAIREKTGGTELIKSGDMAGMIQGISGGNFTYTSTYNYITIGQSAYRNNQFIKAVDVKSCSEIGAHAFQDATSLETVDVNYGNYSEAYSYNCKIGGYAFCACNALKRVRIGRCSDIQTRAFISCGSLEEVNIGAPRGTHVNQLGDTSIGNYAFAACKNLKTVNISWIDTIGEFAFDGCTSLEQLDLSCNTIGAGAFMDCEKLTTLILRRDIVNVMDLTAFVYTPIMNFEGYVYVPTSLYESYRAAYSDALDQGYADMGYPITGVFDMLFRKIEDYPEICG